MYDIDYLCVQHHLNTISASKRCPDGCECYDDVTGLTENCATGWSRDTLNSVARTTFAL